MQFRGFYCPWLGVSGRWGRGSLRRTRGLRGMEVGLYTQHPSALSIIGEADEVKIESEIPIQDS